MEHLHHRILFPLFPTYMQTPAPENALSSQNEHTPGSMWAQTPSSRSLLWEVSAPLKEQYYDPATSLYDFFFSDVYFFLFNIQPVDTNLIRFCWSSQWKTPCSSIFT